jgi:hypothetical protein
VAVCIVKPFALNTLLHHENRNRIFWNSLFDFCDVALVLCSGKQAYVRKLSDRNLNLLDGFTRVICNMYIHWYIFTVVVKLHGRECVISYSVSSSLLHYYYTTHLLVQTGFKMNLIWFQHKFLANFNRRLLADLWGRVHDFPYCQPYGISFVRLILGAVAHKCLELVIDATWLPCVTCCGNNALASIIVVVKSVLPGAGWRDTLAGQCGGNSK